MQVCGLVLNVCLIFCIVHVCNGPSSNLNKSVLSRSTVMCLSIGTPKTINFPFVPNGKLIIFRCPKIKAHYSLIMMFLNIGAPRIY